MHILSILLTTIEVLVCLMLIGLVLIQRSKGEGLSAAFGGGMGESIFGANVGNIVTRITVILGLVFLVNTIILTMILTASRGSASSGSVMDDVPSAPATAPGIPGLPPSREAPSAPVAPAPAPMSAPAPASVPAPTPASAAP